MVWRLVPRQLIAVAMGSVLLGGCTSAVLQTPTLSYWDPGKGEVGHPKEFSKYGAAGKKASVERNTFSDSYALTFAKDEDTDREAVHNEYYFHPLPYNLEHYSEIGKRWSSSSKDAKADGRFWERREFRNFVQNDLLRRSDQICSAYLTRIVHGFAVGTAAGKTAKSAFGVLQTLAAPASFVADAVQVSGAGLTGLGTTEILQYKVFTDTSQSIIKSRRAIRNAIRSAQKEDTNVYDISQALYDAERYHTVCNYATQWAAGPDIATAENEIILVKSEPAASGTKAAEKKKDIETAPTPKAAIQ